MLLEDLIHDILLIIFLESLGNVVLFWQFVVVLEDIASIAVDLRSLLLASLYGLLGLLVVIYFLLQTEKNFNIV
jgi:hypothetical protein